MGVDRARQWLASYNDESFIKLNDHERQVQQFLQDQARNANPADPVAACLTYGDLCHAIDPDEHIWKRPRYKGIGQALGHVSLYEVHHHRPLLSALVIRAGFGDPGDGFINDLCRGTLSLTIPEGQERTFWQSKVDEVVRFWTSHDPIAITDMMFDALMEEIAELRQGLSRTDHPG